MYQNRYLMYLLIILLVVLSQTVGATEARMSFSVDSFNIPHTKELDLQAIQALNQLTGFSSSRRNFLLEFQDGFLGVGIRQRQINYFTYNEQTVEALRYIWKEKKTPQYYEQMALKYTHYLRDDFSIHFYLEKQKWQLEMGAYLSRGKEPFVIDLFDGSIDGRTDYFAYNYESYVTYWEKTETVGKGYGMYLNVDYQITDQLSLHFKADDLFSKLVWTEIEEFHGKIDLDFISADELGYTQIDAPIQGVYHPDGRLEIKENPLWRGELSFQQDHYHIESWLQYRDYWQWGLDCTLKQERFPDLVVGVFRQNHQNTYKVGLETGDFKIGLAANSIIAGEQTDYQIYLQALLF